MEVAKVENVKVGMENVELEDLRVEDEEVEVEMVFSVSIKIKRLLYQILCTSCFIIVRHQKLSRPKKKHTYSFPPFPKQSQESKHKVFDTNLSGYC